MVSRLAILVLLISASVSAQTGRLGGVVVDAEGRGIDRASVVIEGTARGAATDADGRFEIGDLAPGMVTVAASRVGYRTVRTVAEVGEGTTEVRLVLVEVALEAGEVVVTARETLTGRGTLDLPGSGHYVGARALEQIGGNDVHRVLREVPGVTIQEEDGYGLRPNIGLRGSGAERSSTITLMEDGVLIAPAPYAAPAAYYFPSVGRMDGVEVRTGAGQIKYGPATSGGALNLIAADIPSGPEARGEVTLGPNYQRTLHARPGTSVGSVDWLGGLGVGVVAEVRTDDVDGFKTIQGADGSALLGPGGDGFDTGYDKTDWFGRVRLTTAPGATVFQSLTATASATDEISDETYLGLTDADFRAAPYTRYAGSQLDQMDADHRALRARHVAMFSDRIDLTTTVYRNAFARNWYKLDKASGADGVAVGIADLLADPAAFASAYDAVRGAGTGTLAVKANNREYLSQGVQSTLGLRLGTATRGALVEAGLRLHADEMDRFQWVDQFATEAGTVTITNLGVPGTDSNRIESARAIAGFVQAEATVGRLALTPGLRVESVRLRREDYGTADPERTGADLAKRENTATALIPGLAARLDVGAGWRVFGGLHRGFAPPDSREETAPESSLNAEVGVRYSASGVEVQAAGYRTAYSNLLGSDLAASGGGGTADQFNGGDVDVWGAELGISADLGRALGMAGWAAPVRLAYTWTDARFQTAFESDFEAWGTVAVGDELPYQARHRMYVRAGVERGGWSAAVLANAVSAMRAVAGQGEIAESDRVGAHATLDLVGEAPLPGGLRLVGRVVNVTDATYEVARRPAGLRPGLPRTVTVGLRARLGR